MEKTFTVYTTHCAISEIQKGVVCCRLNTISKNCRWWHRAEQFSDETNKRKYKNPKASHSVIF